MGSFQRTIASTAFAGQELFGEAIYQGMKTQEQRWLLLKSVLAKSQNVSYWRHALIMYSKLFGLEGPELTDDNWKLIDKSIHQKSQDPSWYDHVMRNLCKLQTQIRMIPWFEDWEDEYFTGVLRMENALRLHEAKIRKELERHLDQSIGSLEAAKQALLRLVEAYAKRGAIGIKLAHAYSRSLHSVPVNKEDAARIFEQAMRADTLGVQKIRQLQDHMIFYLAELAQGMNMVFQIHTGVQTNWSNVADSNPLLLIPLLKAFPGVHFDLLHAGYPFSRSLGMLGKHYPNVWLNMAWMYVVSMAASRQILSEWIDLVPGYRILGFGSDTQFPEMVYAHLLMARSCVTDVLTAKVERDFLSEEEAVNLGRKMLRDNGMELYGLT